MLTLLLLTISVAAIAASIAASAHRPVPVVEALPVAALGLRWSRLRDVRTGNGPRVLWAGEGDTAHFRAALNAARPALSDVGFSWGTRERNGGDVIPVCWENPARPESDVLDAVAVAEQSVMEKAEADRLKAEAAAAAEAAAWYRDGAARQEAVDALRASLRDKPWAWSRRKADLAPAASSRTARASAMPASPASLSTRSNSWSPGSSPASGPSESRPGGSAPPTRRSALPPSRPAASSAPSMRTTPPSRTTADGRRPTRIAATSSPASMLSIRRKRARLSGRSTRTGGSFPASSARPSSASPPSRFPPHPAASPTRQETPMRLARFIATVAAAALSAMALIPRLVWEGGRWVTKNVFGSGAGNAAAAQAQAAAELQAAASEVAAAKAAPAPAPEPASPVGTLDWEWGTAALRVLAGDRDAGQGVLDEAAISYLEKLTPDQGMRLAAFSPDRIGRHLTGNHPIKSLPQATSLHDYWTAEIRRLTAESAKAVPLLRVDEHAGLSREERLALAR